MWPGCSWSLVQCGTVRWLLLTAMLHAYASTRQRGGGREYYLKWDKKIQKRESPSFTPCDFPFSPQPSALCWFLLLHLCLNFISSFIPKSLAGLCPSTAWWIFNKIKPDNLSTDASPWHVLGIGLSSRVRGRMRGQCVFCWPLLLHSPQSNRRARGNAFKQFRMEFHHEEKRVLHWDSVRAKHVSRKGWGAWAEIGKQQVNWLAL